MSNDNIPSFVERTLIEKHVLLLVLCWAWGDRKNKGAKKLEGR